MRRLALLLSLLPALVACPPEKSEDGHGMEPIKVLDPKAPPKAKGSETLTGHKVVVVADGAWTQRRLDRGGEGGPSGRGVTIGATEGFGGGGIGTLGRGSGAAPTGAPPPPAEAPAPAKDESVSAPGDGFGAVLVPKKRAKRKGRTDDFPGRPQPFAQPAPPSASPLRASSTDDNADFDLFLKFLARWSDRPDTASKQQFLDVRDRRYIKVVDRDGKPVPGAEVEIRASQGGGVIYAGTTYGDGQVPFYPRVYDRERKAGDFLVEVRYDGKRVSRPWPNTEAARSGSIEVRLDVARERALLMALDVMFIIDTTGSMGDEIDRIKASLLNVTEKLRGLQQEFDLRYGGVLYRDVSDSYLTATHPFTGDIEAFDRALKTVAADGGGDTPESLNQGLAQAIHGVAWRPGAAKVAFLIADAPPHMDYEDDVPYGESLKDALAIGVRIHSVAASGLDPFGTLVFRQTAQFTRGKFIFIEYGSSAASAAQHGVTGQVQSNNLDDIIFRQLSWELAHWGREG